MHRPSQPFIRRSWWWVFALLIALPAIALAFLGFSAIQADEVERRRRTSDEQARIARLANSALSTAFEREVAEARASLRTASSEGPDAKSRPVLFEIDDRHVISFPADRVYMASPMVPPPSQAATRIPGSAAALAERAQSAEAQARTAEAVALYGRLRQFPVTRAWADHRLIVLQADLQVPSTVYQIADRRLGSSDARSPSGIPLALVASSLVDDVPQASRQHFVPLLEQALLNLRAGQWWLRMEQRRAYDGELRRWLADTLAGPALDPDTRLDVLSRLAAIAGTAFTESHRLPSRVQMVGTGPERTLLVWIRPSQSTLVWSGLAFSSERADSLITAAIEPLLGGQPYRAALRDTRSTIWGSVVDADSDRVWSLESAPGWTLMFSGVAVSSTTNTQRLLNYGRVIFPMIVLTCGLVMTAWIIRRDLALTEMQSTFVAAVTHEFKSPITSIRLLMERLGSGRSADSPERYYAAIAAEAARLEGLVNRLLEAQQLQRGQKAYAFRQSSLEHIVREAIDRMRPQADAKQIELVLRVGDAIPPLALDPESVSDGVRNLIDNAIKYSPGGTRVALSLERSSGDVVLSVSDQGVGVDPAEAERIFQPFYRSRRGDRANVHGTGLGLALVRATAEAHGGSIAVESDGERGSRFTLTLPIRAHRAEHIETSSASTVNAAPAGWQTTRR
jgi:signal transduction histidine kinase